MSSDEISGERMERFYALDILRAVAAFAVVIYHWAHFMPPFLQANTGGELPFAQVLGSIYAGGYRAVPLFFTLSGFVFFWLYADQVSSKSLGAWRFTVLRFSRLYPLHFFTLLVVVVMQGGLLKFLGTPFVYTENHYCPVISG